MIVALSFSQADSESVYKELLRIRYTIAELEDYQIPSDDEEK